MRTLEQELEAVHKELQKVAAFDKSKETHPGGWKLWCFDVHGEEVLILLEIEKRDQIKEMVKNPNDKQVGGEHYRKADAEFQHWDLVAEYGLSYFLGNMTKYVCRWRAKGGIKDLHKAIHYLEKLISLNPSYVPVGRHATESGLKKANQFCQAQGLSSLEKDIIIRSINYYTLSDLLTIHTKLEELILVAENEEKSIQKDAT